MKICYFFPIFKDVNAKKFFEEFSKSEFYKTHTDRKIVFACENSDNKNLSYLKTIPNITLNVFEKKFSYNDAFKPCLKDFDGDVLLLGDCALCGIDTVFEMCLEEHKNGADIVHLAKSFGKAKGLFANLWSNCSKLFSTLVANQKDSGNVLSLGLYSRDVVEIMQSLPEKSCLLKNSDSLVGFVSKTIFIDGSSETYSPDFHKKSSAIKSALVCNIIFIVALALMITLDILFPVYQLAITLVAVFFILVSLSVCLMMICKHFFDLRNTGEVIEYSTEEKVKANSEDKEQDNKGLSAVKTSKNNKQPANKKKVVTKDKIKPTKKATTKKLKNTTKKTSKATTSTKKVK